MERSTNLTRDSSEGVYAPPPHTPLPHPTYPFRLSGEDAKNVYPTPARLGCTTCKTALKGNSHQEISVANMIELLLKSFLVFGPPMFKAKTDPKRPVEVSCDITQHLMAYQTAVDTRTNSSGMRTHTGQHSRLASMHALIFA